MISTNLQFDMFPTVPAWTPEPETLQLMRPHKWAHGAVSELPLVSIELTPHDGKWMWACCLNSHNGAGQGSRALPKWGRFADSKLDALLKGADAVRQFQHRATRIEQGRICVWLAEIVSAAISSGNR